MNGRACKRRRCGGRISPSVFNTKVPCLATCSILAQKLSFHLGSIRRRPELTARVSARNVEEN